MFFSKEQIEQSLKRLEGLNPFFGTVFLAFKKADIPVGTTATINFSQTVIDLLQMYYRPRSDYEGYYIPFETANKKKYWEKHHCINNLSQIARSTFSDSVENQNSNSWGWKIDYITNLRKKHLKGNLIPSFDLAVWLFRSREWDAKFRVTDVIDAFFKEFHISEEEKLLFNKIVPVLVEQPFQGTVISKEILLDVIGLPQGEEGATLELLKLMDVGPAEQIEWRLTPRLNIITGDNGLGKTFLLESAWWALTGTWAGTFPAYPRQDVARNAPRIAFQIGKKSQRDRIQTAAYNWSLQEWATAASRKLLPGLSLFSQADDSFAVWDPAKHLLADERKTDGASEALLRLSRSQVWDGIEDEQSGKKRVICNGLIRDWVTWQTIDKAQFDIFCAALKALSPHPIEEPLIPGQPTRILGDTRYIPTLKFPYGEVPILLCSAGIQRIVALTYLLVWAWNEHLVTSKIMHREPQRSIVLLIDEMEAHLHPFWQRVIVPALMNVVHALANEVQTQVIIATHSPLVLASVEPQFDEDNDALFHLYLDEVAVKLDHVPFVKRGRVDLWLMSDLFGLEQPRSKDAEEAIEDAKELQRKRTPSKEEVQEVSNRLLRVLAQDDDFWPRWTYFAEQRGASL